MWEGIPSIAGNVKYMTTISKTLKLDKCMTLWGQPDQVHVQNVK